MADLPDNPNNREEEYLADIAGLPNNVPENPWSRKEAYLAAISGRLDGIDAKIAALATDISLKGGVADYDHLPEDAEIGDAYITEDTGILYVWVGDEWTPLNMQGGEGVKELTEADYNYPTDNPQAIAMWLLDSGYYKVKYTNGVQPKIIGGTSMSSTYEYNDGAILPIWDAFHAKLSIWSNYNSTGTLIKSYLVYSSGLGSYAYSQELSSPTVVQTTGTSQADVMSQNATTSMVFADPSTRNKVQIGNSNTSTSGDRGVAIGPTAYARGAYSIGIGNGCASNGAGTISLGSNALAFDVATGGIALGAYSKAEVAGQLDVGSTNTTYGYNSTNYRLLTGLYDGQSAHDAATVGQTVGTTESTTIATSDWAPLASSDPYDHSATVTLTATIGANSIVELVNDQAVLFGTYGFAIGSISGQNVVIYSIGQPDASVTLKLNVKG